MYSQGDMKGQWVTFKRQGVSIGIVLRKISCNLISISYRHCKNCSDNKNIFPIYVVHRKSLRSSALYEYYILWSCVFCAPTQIHNNKLHAYSTIWTNSTTRQKAHLYHLRNMQSFRNAPADILQHIILYVPPQTRCI